ncbi:glycine cleavage system aminomethyltransferase GcvT [Carnobacterium jeotgali]|uniref:glycine cleavage system aminomethyltransferase GcvT n=1 Tax=Carnobacterium jeotgali TaxID=545534 RepID=UPI0038909956
MEKELKKTPLFNYYKEKNVKLMDFGGWALPVQFSGIADEHKSVRTYAGLFDVSHMGEILVKGKDAGVFLNYLLTNDVSKIKIGQAQYNAIVNEHGGTIDDLIIFKLDEEGYLVTPNASNSDKVFQWMEKHLTGDVVLENRSEDIGLLALQGPNAERILQKLANDDLSKLKPFHFFQHVELNDLSPVLISRTGYTGEDGFEVYLEAKETEKLWHLLLEVGLEEGLQPCGLGARDTLRLEASLSLYGNELSDTISPLQGGIGFAVKTKKEADFIGKAALTAQLKSGVDKKIKGLELIGKGIARHGYKVLDEAGSEIGVITSGTKSPTLGSSIALALLSTNGNEVGTKVKIEVRNKLIDAVIVETPFYKREKQLPK